jgi:hypothetical protein
MSAENVSEEPRWQAFNQDGFPCSCGERHVGLFPVNMLTPAMWDGPKEYAPDEEIQLDRTFISESYCVWRGQNFAMRMRLPLQMRGASPAAFMYTVWAAVERADLQAYIAAKAQNTLRNDARFPARLVSRIAGHHDTVNLMGLAFQQEDGWPPLLLLAALGADAAFHLRDACGVAQVGDDVDAPALARALAARPLGGSGPRA